MVADFLSGSAEAVLPVPELCQFGLVNRQLCGGDLKCPLEVIDKTGSFQFEKH